MLPTQHGMISILTKKSKAMQQYHDLAKRILEEGVNKSSGRAGMPDTRSVFGHQMRFNLQEGFPLLTTKKVNLNNILVELIWFLKGDTNIKFLVDNGCNIWNADAYRWYKTKHKELTGYDGSLSKESFIGKIKEGELEATSLSGYGYRLGDLGSVYGAQWRDWKGFNSEQIDQIKVLLDGLKDNPYGRRHIVTAWNPADLSTMALPPCHLLYHFNCRPATTEERDKWAWDNGLQEEYKAQGSKSEDEWNEWYDEKGVPKIVLDCLMYQRSTDVGLGLGYNIASYALLTEIIAKMTGKIAGEFIWTGGDTHFYNNHFDGIKVQLDRIPKTLPILKISDRVASLDDPVDINIEDFELIGYDPHPFIKLDLSVGTA